MKPKTLLLSKISLFVLSLLPLVRVAYLVLTARAVNPIELITRSTGTWTLVFLMVTLSITPLRKLTGWNVLIKFRRMLGLFAFFYVFLHFSTYIWLDQSFDFTHILKDIYKRPFITVGFAAFVLMLPLAITSTDSMMRRLRRNWTRLHYAIYPIAILGVLHYWWLVKRDITQPIIYAVILGVLLGYRVCAKLPKSQMIARAQRA